MDHSTTVARAVAVLTTVLAVGCALLAVGHAGVDVPLLSALGPGGDRVILPAVIGFGVAGVLAAIVSMGLFRRRAWAWALGLVLGGVVLAGSAMPFRGVSSAIGIGLSAAIVILLLLPPARAALLGRG